MEIAVQVARRLDSQPPGNPEARALLERLYAVADEVGGLQRNRYAADHVPLDDGP